MTRRNLFVIGLAVAAIALGVLLVVMRGAISRNSEPSPAQNLAVTIDDRTFTLVDGVAEKQTAPGSAGKETVRVVQGPVMADVNADGKAETALILSDDTGGSGTFYYAVLAIDDGGKWRSTNALPLGDRIKPQGIDVIDGNFVFRFLERQRDEPMATEPSVLTSVPVRFNPESGKISAWG